MEPSPSPAPPAAGGGARPLTDALAEARRLVALAGAQGLTVRLMGGLAFGAQVPAWTTRGQRQGRDIDLCVGHRDQRDLTAFLAAQGYVPDRSYNALYGARQLYFVDPTNDRPVDVLIDRLAMCHRLEFAERLTLEPVTLPLADLLLTKLQIVRINRKDLLDALALLVSYPLGEGDQATINLPRIVELTAADWGWWRTVTGNLTLIRQFVGTDLSPGEFVFEPPPFYEPLAQLAALEAAIAAAPKSMRWRMRAQVGDRVTWYEEPEEVRHDGGASGA